MAVERQHGDCELRAQKGSIKALEVTPEKEIVWTYTGPHNIHKLQVLTTSGKLVEGSPLK